MSVLISIMWADPHPNSDHNPQLSRFVSDEFSVQMSKESKAKKIRSEKISAIFKFNNFIGNAKIIRNWAPRKTVLYKPHYSLHCITHNSMPFRTVIVQSDSLFDKLFEVTKFSKRFYFHKKFSFI